MIAGWLIKLVVSIAVVGFLAVEIGTPVIVRVQTDGNALEAANEADSVFRDRGNVDVAKAAAEEIAVKSGADLEEFSIDDQGRAHVTLRKQAKSYLLKKWDRLASWYDVRVSATSEGRR